MPAHGRPLAPAGVSPVRTATVSVGPARPSRAGLGGDPGQRGLQVLLDVGGERPQRRDVDDLGPPAARRRRRRPGAAAR